MSFNVIIPAAGAATRLRPLTSNCSKAMIRLHGKPAIAYILDKLYSEGADDVVIVDGQFDDIRQYCSEHYPLVKFVQQKKLNGPRDAISLGFDKLDDIENPLVVWLGDTLVFDKGLPLGTNFLLTKTVDDHSQWCMWDGTSFYNKPTEQIKNGLALVGVYSFNNGNHAKYSFLGTDGYEISDALEMYGSEFDSLNTKEWHDIGTLSSYQKTCASLLSIKSRAFNTFKYNDKLNVIEKVGNDADILAELKWYRNLTPEQNLFVPRLLDDGSNRLKLSYESGTLVSDLFLYEDITSSTASYILNKVFDIMEDNFWLTAHMKRDGRNTWDKRCKKMWYDKTVERIGGLFSCKDKLLSIAKDASKKFHIVSTIHGDLHGGNILYDPYNDSITMIDPRGSFGGCLINGGDLYYDLAKLSHDFYHGYGGMVVNKEYPSYIKEIFVDILEQRGYNINTVNDLGCLLIATCIPLHYEDADRQYRMKQYVEQYFENNRS